MKSGAVRTSIFEQIIEGGARVVWTLAAFARRLLLDHDSNRIERTVISFVLRRNAGGNWLVAFEAARRIKMLALFAGVEREATLRTLA
jgi:hypothetical protein